MYALFCHLQGRASGLQRGDAASKETARQRKAQKRRRKESHEEKVGEKMLCFRPPFSGVLKNSCISQRTFMCLDGTDYPILLLQRRQRWESSAGTGENSSYQLECYSFCCGLKYSLWYKPILNGSLHSFPQFYSHFLQQSWRCVNYRLPGWVHSCTDISHFL